MTDLTEQWKKGELPVGSYYASYLGEPRVWLYRDKQNQTDDLEYEIYEVLAKVPSYNEWKNFVDANTSLFDTVKMLEKDNFRLKKQNAELKELLKDCRLAIYDYPPYDLASDKIRLMNKIDEVLNA